MTSAPNTITLKFVGIKPITKQTFKISRGRMYQPNNYNVMKQAIHTLAAQEARQCGWILTSEEVECHGKMYVPKGERSPDLDNGFAGISDALQGVIYTNDNHITKLIYERFKNVRPTWEIELYFRIRD